MQPSNSRRWRRTGIAFFAILLLAVSRLLAADKDFSIVVLPDPQHYASKYHKVGMAQTDWIAENAQKLQIKFVVSVGDNVDRGWMDDEFKQSVSFMDKLNNVVPYGVACGNHDLKDGKKGYTSLKFLDYYGPQKFKYPWYGGASPSGFSSYQTFSGGGMKFLALELTVAAPMDEIEWAKKVIAEHPRLPVILTTHQMLDPQGQIPKTKAAGGTGRQPPTKVWKQLVEPSSQIFLVICGHYHGESYITKQTKAAQPVHVVLQDYQDEKNGGNGWLRIFTFRPDANKIDVQTYSPSLKEYKKAASSEFSFPVDFKKLPAPASATGDAELSRRLVGTWVTDPTDKEIGRSMATTTPMARALRPCGSGTSLRAVPFGSPHAGRSRTAFSL